MEHFVYLCVSYVMFGSCFEQGQWFKDDGITCLLCDISDFVVAGLT